MFCSKILRMTYNLKKSLRGVLKFMKFLPHSKIAGSRDVLSKQKQQTGLSRPFKDHSESQRAS